MNKHYCVCMNITEYVIINENSDIIVLALILYKSQAVKHKSSFM